MDATLRLYRATYWFGQGSASSVAIGLGPGELLLISPPAGEVAPSLLNALAELGTVTSLLAPNGNHRLGVRGGQERFPEAVLYAPELMLDRVGAKAVRGRPPRPMAELVERLPAGVELLVPPHVKRPDVVGHFATPAGGLWYLNDLVVNLDSLGKPPLSWLLGFLDFRVGLAVNGFGCRNVVVQDRPAFARWFAEELERVPPIGAVFGHGEPVLQPEPFRGLAAEMRAALRVPAS